jgi:hypothetical protein
MPTEPSNPINAPGWRQVLLAFFCFGLTVTLCYSGLWLLERELNLYGYFSPAAAGSNQLADLVSQLTNSLS